MFTDAIRALFKDPVIAPTILILAISVLILVLSVLRAAQTTGIDATLLPAWLRDYGVEWLMLTFVAAFVWVLGWVYPPESRDLLQTLGLAGVVAAYSAGVATILAKDVAKLISLIPGTGANKAFKAAARTDLGSGGPTGG